MRAAIALMMENRWARAVFTGCVVWGLFCAFFGIVSAFQHSMDEARLWWKLGAIIWAVAGGIIGAFLALSAKENRR